LKRDAAIVSNVAVAGKGFPGPDPQQIEEIPMQGPGEGGGGERRFEGKTGRLKADR